MPDALAPSRSYASRTIGTLVTPYLAISVGGALGANARYVVATWGAAEWGTQFPVATLLINVTGSFGLGLFLALATERFKAQSAIRLLVATGFFGAYTTFSTFSVETWNFVEAGNLAAAVGYAVASAALCIATAAFGVVVAHAITSQVTARGSRAVDPEPT